MSIAMNKADPFRTLYDANQHRVRGLLARMVGPQEAEDLAQAVFAKAANALPAFRGDAEASTWLYRIAVNVASDWLRGRSTQEAKLTVPFPDAADEEPSIEDNGSASIAPQLSPEQELARKDMRDCIRNEIGNCCEGNGTGLMSAELSIQNM